MAVTRLAKLPTLALDRSRTDKAVVGLVPRVLGGPGRIRVAAAYVTGDVPKHLGLKKARIRDLALICDPFGGNCDPAVLTSLMERDADVRAVPGLHAKVYIGRRAVVVGSANLSEGALRGGRPGTTLEALACLTGRREVEEAEKWFDSLAQKAMTWEAILADELQRTAIETAYRNKQGRSGGSGARRQSLLEALARPDLLEGAKVLFSLTRWVRSAPSDRTVRTVAGGHNLDLPSDWTYSYSDDASAEQIAFATRLQEQEGGDHQVITLWVTLDRDEQIVKVQSIDDTPARLIRSVVANGRLYTFYGDEHRCDVPFDLRGPARTEATKVLNAKLERRSRLVAEINRVGFATPAQMARWIA